MKKILSLAIILLLAFTTTLSPALAKPTPARSDIVNELKRKPQKKLMTNQELFITMVAVIAEYGEIPASYKYVQIENSGTYPGSRLYDAYQKAVYLDILKPSQIPLKLSGTATHKKMVELTNLFYGEKKGGVTLVDGTQLTAIDKKLTYNDLLFYAANYLGSRNSDAPVQNAPGFEILSDVYGRLLTEHIDKDSLDKRELLYGAIRGMAEATNDPYTSYFPPVAAQEFNDELNGEFEGIGTYVDMSKPGEFIITSPIPGSPAEKAGIKGGDRVLKVSDFEITKETGVEEVIRKIKGPSGTSVTLEILRGAEKFSITIVRAKIKLELVTYEKIDSNTSLIKITSFWSGTQEGFANAVEKMKADGTTRAIIDLRNNPGGDVNEVSEMLNYFVPAHSNKLSVRTLSGEEVYLSTGDDSFFSSKEIVILINKGTASASEIMTWTIQDYLPNRTKVIGEKSYGKGSVQSLLPYSDGSSLKYTVAKWYTGKTSKSIDKVGIEPDVTVELDVEKFRTGTDTQLEYAKSLRY